MAEIEKNPSLVTNTELAQRFAQFVMMQAQNIYYVLGRIPSPDGRQIPPNLEAAKILIDQLEMIQAKTKGNLHPQEASLMDDALKNVRLAFVEASGGTPASMMPKTRLPEFPLEDEEEPTPQAEAKPAASAPEPGQLKSEPAENKKKFTKSYG